MKVKSNLRILMAKNEIDGVSDLMQISGLSRNTINRLYKGTEDQLRGVTLNSLVCLCGVFKCELSDLIEFLDENK